jgi:post-segregation antitoxin (ccd killing protein)
MDRKTEKMLKELIEDMTETGLDVSSIHDLLNIKPSTEKGLIEDLKKVGINISSVWELANGFDNYELAEPILLAHNKVTKEGHYKDGILCAIKSVQRKLIEDLKQVGINVSSVWDLVNGPTNYSQAEPILIKHLKIAKGSRYKEGIVRALGVKGFNNAVRLLLDEFKNSKDESYKWAVANSLSIIASREVLQELIAIMADRTHGHARQMIADALGRIRDKAAVKVLIESLDDDDVASHAVDALGMIGDPAAIEPIRRLLNHDRAWIRKAAKTALAHIEKRRLKSLNC